MDSTGPNPVRVGVAQAVTKAMTDARVTQLALADATGIPRTTLLRRLAGHQPFTVDELHRIAAYLDVPLTTLVAPDAA